MYLKSYMKDLFETNMAGPKKKSVNKENLMF